MSVSTNEYKKTIGRVALFFSIFTFLAGWVFLGLFSMGVKEVRAAATQGNARTYYIDTTQTSPNQLRLRDYASSSSTWGAESSAQQTTTTTINNVVVETAPTRDEKLVGEWADTGTANQSELRVFRWRGDTSTTTLIYATTTAADMGANVQTFDIAYENSSGDALIVFTTGQASTNEIAYVTWNGTTTSSTQLFDVAGTTERVEGIRLTSWATSSSDRIALTYTASSTTNSLNAAVWNGSAWESNPSTPLETGALDVAPKDSMQFDIAFEDVSGEILAVWGGGAAANNFRYNTCTGGPPCSWGTTANSGTSEEGTVIAAASRQGTNEIFVVMASNNGNDTGAGYWNGSAWTVAANLDLTNGDPDVTFGQQVAAGWLEAGGAVRAIGVYGDAAAAGLDFAQWDGTSLTLPADLCTTGPPVTLEKQIKIKQNPYDKSWLLALVKDINADLYGYKVSFDGTNLNCTYYSTSTFNVNVGVNTDRSFSFAYDIVPPAPQAVLTQEHHRWYENIDSATPTTALANLDTQAKGVDNSVPIRLRMNVGVTSVALGAGNAFKLQYSTATSSGWADIGAAGSGTIWRAYDNTTSASGSTLPSLLIASSTVAASYEEGVTSTGTPSIININDFGEWDWSIQNNGAATGTTYYFRMIRGNSDPLNSYTRWPSITTPGNAQISVATSATYYVGQATTTIQIITVTATGSDAITAYGDIRIKIASSSTNMQWDTTDTLATLGGTASGKASTTVSYPDAYTLKIDVTSDFTATDTLDISGLSFTNFNAVNTATSGLRLFRGGPNDTASDASPSQTAAIKGALTLGNHPAGQEGDKFATSTSVTDELLAFQLTPDGENASTTLIIRLSSLTGITTADLGTFEVIRDDNKDGSLSGDSTAFFGTPTATTAGPDIELRFINTTSTVPNGTSTAFILRGTVNNLVAGDAMTVQLPSANITADGQTTALRLNAAPNSVGGSLSADGGPHQENAISRTLRSYRWYNDDGSGVNNATAMAGGETAASNVRIGQRLASRFQVDNTGGPEGSGIVYRLQWNTSTSSSGWEDVGANTSISYSLGLAGANNDAITTSTATTSPCCTFTNGTWHENVATSSGGVTLGAGKFTEFVYMVKTDKASPGTNYYLRLINGTASTTLDATPASALAPLTTTSTANDIRRFSKEAVDSIPTVTSQLAYFFDDLDYTRGTTVDGNFAAIQSSSSVPMMRFSNRNATTSDQINVDWVGKSSVAFSTAPVFLEAYRFGSTTAWVTMASDSATLANTTTTISASVTSNVSEYYEQDGSNFWTNWRVRQASTTATLSTDAPDIKFLGLVTLTSSSSQTFVVGDSATAISTTTVTDSPSSPRIKAANDIRIRIPSGLNLEWDASTTVATMSGSAWTSNKVTSTVSYSGDFKTLIIDVTSDFAANDTLTISGLKYRNFTQASASSSRALRADGAADVTDDATDNQTITIRGKFDEANHAAGQEPNKFDGDATSLTAAELFAFQMVRTGEDMNAATVTIALSNISGFASSSITNAKIYIDSDGDGTIGAGETTTVGATGTVSITGGTGTLTFSGTWTATGTRNYILKADVSSIDDGDTLTFGLPTANVNATGATSQVSIPVGGSITNASHGKPSQARGGQPTGGAAPAVTSVGGGTGAGGGAPSGGAPPTATTTTGGGAGGGGGAP